MFLLVSGWGCSTHTRAREPLGHVSRAPVGGPSASWLCTGVCRAPSLLRRTRICPMCQRRAMPGSTARWAPAAMHHPCVFVWYACFLPLHMHALLHPRTTPRQRYTFLLLSSPLCTFLGACGAVQGCRASAGTRVSLRVCTSRQARMQEGLRVAAEGLGRLLVPASICLVRTSSDGHSHPICWQGQAPSAAPPRPTVTLAEGSGSARGGVGWTGRPCAGCDELPAPRERGHD